MGQRTEQRDEQREEIRTGKQAEQQAVKQAGQNQSELGGGIQSDNLSAAYVIIVGDRIVARRGDLESACNLQHELYEEWTLRKTFTESDEGPVLARVLPRGDFQTGRRITGKDAKSKQTS